MTEEHIRAQRKEHSTLPPVRPRNDEERRAVATSLEAMKGSVKIHGDVVSATFDEASDWNEERNLDPVQSN